jgi:two-component system sensor histidine kinase MprB
MSWLRRKSLRVRLSALVAAAVGLTVALAAFATYQFVHHQLYHQVESSLDNEWGVLTTNSGAVNPSQVGNFFGQYNNSLLQIIDSSGNPIPVPGRFGGYLPVNSNLPVTRGDLAVAGLGGGGPTLRNITVHGQSYRLLTVGTDVVEDGISIPAVTQIAVPLTDIQHSLADLRLILWLVTFCGVAVGVGLGYIIGRDTIRPVERLTAAAEHVAATQDLDSTIDDRGEDELGRLARAFNSMLRALAASRHQQAQLISDAGHELRTPLTSLRTNIEVLIRVKDLPDGDRAELLADVHAQLEEMTTLVGDVVELAREDEAQSEPIEVRFDPIVEHAVERARRRAPAVVFDVELMPGSIRAHPALLERAVLNVLDNAAKWSPPDGTIRVRLDRGEWWTLEVHDQGPGIATADLPHVFERFYRAETARALPGSGLGLAIVQQVVTAHGGTVAALSPPGGGTLIRIQLPTVVENEPDSPDIPAFLGPEPARPPDQSEPAPFGPAPFGPAPSGPAQTGLAGVLPPDVELLEPNPYREPASWGPEDPGLASPGGHPAPANAPSDGRRAPGGALADPAPVAPGRPRR